MHRRKRGVGKSSQSLGGSPTTAVRSKAASSRVGTPLRSPSIPHHRPNHPTLGCGVRDAGAAPGPNDGIDGEVLVVFHHDRPHGGTRDFRSPVHRATDATAAPHPELSPFARPPGRRQFRLETDCAQLEHESIDIDELALRKSVAQRQIAVNGSSPGRRVSIPIRAPSAPMPAEVGNQLRGSFVHAAPIAPGGCSRRSRSSPRARDRTSGAQLTLLRQDQARIPVRYRCLEPREPADVGEIVDEEHAKVRGGHRGSGACDARVVLRPWERPVSDGMDVSSSRLHVFARPSANEDAIGRMPRHRHGIAAVRHRRALAEHILLSGDASLVHPQARYRSCASRLRTRHCAAHPKCGCGRERPRARP